MKLHFEDDLDYQNAAIASVVSLFKGQEISRSEFTVTFQPESSPNLMVWSAPTSGKRHETR